MLRSAVVASLCALAALTGGAAGRHAVDAKIDPRVVADTAAGADARFLVVLAEQADVGRATGGAADRDEQGRRAVRALRRVSAAQAGVRAELERRGVSYRPFWVVNAVAVTGDRALAETLAARDDVAAVQPDRPFAAVASADAAATSSAPRGVEWNVRKIGAPELWARGFTGQGTVYANADTGVRWDAPGLKRSYRGWNGTTADHAYSWWDAVHEDLNGNGTNPCGFDTKAPCDDDASSSSHGTHTMGSAVGDDGAGNQVGVAPGARWIACRNMDEGIGRPSTYIECLQFFLAPTDLAGLGPDPTKRPNVVGNSYSCPPDEGCAVGALESAVDNLRAAGVFMAVAAGNEGEEGCSTVRWPPGPYDSSVTVGATDTADRIAFFSSRGPVQVDGSGRRKPDLVAPGVAIRSTTATGYGILSGTSMATPQVGGAVLLLWSALPQLLGRVDATEELLKSSAVPLTTTDGCGGDLSTTVPNNTFGHGRIDAAAAYRSATGASAPRPGFSVANRALAEGNAGRRSATFTVTLSARSTGGVSVAYRSRGGTARPGSDFVGVAGRLTFGAGQQTKVIRVAILGDRRREPNETFEVVLSRPSGATLRRSVARGTIRNDD